MCYNMKTVFILGKKKEEIMGTKAPYQTKQMKQILAYLQTIEGTHVTAKSFGRKDQRHNPLLRVRKAGQKS